MKGNLLIIGNAVVNETVLNKLKENFDLLSLKSLQNAEILKQFTNLFGIWIHLDTHLPDEYLIHVKKAKFLITTTTGTSHIGREIQNYFGKNLITLQNDRKFLRNISSTAELTWQLVMDSFNDLSYNFDSVQRGEWNRIDNSRDSQLKSKSLGIIGYGRLGAKIARIGRAFDMRVYIYEKSLKKKIRALSHGYSLINDINNLFSLCNLVTIHANYKSGSSPIINARQIALIKKPFVLINTSRAGLVDEDSIVQQIIQNQNFQYYTDVLGFEDNGRNLRDSKLWQLSQSCKRVRITPHIGGASKEAILLCEERLAERLKFLI